MTLSPSSLALHYLGLWASMTIRGQHVAELDGLAHTILGNRKRYQLVQASCGVPWYVVALIHSLEGSLSFTTHLHNGDPLTHRTIHVPKGRPVTGNPPFAWELSAVDALHYDHMDTVDTWTLARICYQLEGYNGWGYHAKGLESPYLWSYSNHYAQGKFTQDGHYDARAVSAQAGAMPLLQRIMAADQTILLPVVSSMPSRIPPLTEVQARLAKLGYYKGGIDGVMGPKTHAAIEAFQRRRGLDVDGLVGPATAVALASG